MDRDASESRFEQLEQEIERLKARNARVEADKAWEVSSFRILTICGITYSVAALLLLVIGAQSCWLGALVPTIGFLVSVQSLPRLKQWWIDKRSTT